MLCKWTLLAFMALLTAQGAAALAGSSPGRLSAHGTSSFARPTLGQPVAYPAPKQGMTKQICNSKDLPDGPHYINDHTLIQGPNGTWHLYGIFHHEPADPVHEVEFVHAVATEPDPAKWDAASFVIPPPDSPVRYALTARADLNETHIWAPHVLRDEARKRWVMVFQASNYGGNNNAAQIKLAVSTDLYTWTRHPKHFIFTDICVARDPKLVQHAPNAWTIYYTRCNNVTGELSGVGYRTTTDFETWSEPQMALVLPDTSPPFKPSFNSAASAPWFCLSTCWGVVPLDLRTSSRVQNHGAVRIDVAPPLRPSASRHLRRALRRVGYPARIRRR